jgi:DNA-directed RNA polymerase I, II, and III subunit RPABC1
LECTGKSNQLGQQAVTTFITETRQNDCQQGIIIAPCLPTKEPNKDVIEALKKTTKSLVQIFCEIELNYDVLSYVYQPRYEVLSEEQAAEFFKVNKIQPTQMPIIRSYDPVAKYLGLFPGTVLKEYNTNLSGETMVDEYITYSIIQ